MLALRKKIKYLTVFTIKRNLVKDREVNVKKKQTSEKKIMRTNGLKR